MANTYKKLAQGQLSGSITTLYTVPASTQAIIKHIRLVNSTGGNLTAALYHDGATAAFIILPTTTILAGGWGEFEGTLTLDPADTIRGIASAATSITYTIYGVEIV